MKIIYRKSDGKILQMVEDTTETPFNEENGSLSVVPVDVLKTLENIQDIPGVKVLLAQESIGDFLFKSLRKPIENEKSPYANS